MTAATPTQTITAKSGVVMQVKTDASEQEVRVVVEKSAGPACVLHWGLVHAGGATWEKPPEAAWPPASKPAGQAVDTLLDEGALTIRLEAGWRFAYLDFVLYHPKTSRWDSDQGRNYRVVLPEPAPRSPELVEKVRALLGEAPPSSDARHEQHDVHDVHDIDDGYRLATAVRVSAAGVEVVLATDLRGPLLCRWGLASPHRDWHLPDAALRPADTRVVDEHAVETPFLEQDGSRVLRLRMPAEPSPAGLCFVLWQPDQGRWWKEHGRDFHLSLSPARSGSRTGSGLTDAGVAAMAEEIIDHETSPSSWTLMHRFNLAWDLLDRVPDEGEGSVAGLALIFVWLRFSAIRQLDWQRNYNTKPRELAHAQERLTAKLGERAGRADARTRPLWRKIAGTVGRGGDGQRVRDGILEIMHRNHVKETTGHFLEEWHQKLHNNTTPDDVVICEAYLEFLRTRGELTAFYRVLEAGGVTRERLLGFERPIRTEPDYVAALRDAFLRDFSEFLGVLRAVHSATDFATSLRDASGLLDEPTRHLLEGVAKRREDPSARDWLFQSITQARESLAGRWRQGRGGARELLYLDLSLEDLARSLVEQNLQEKLSLDVLLPWSLLAVRNLLCSRGSAELSLCLRHFQRLLTLPRGGHDWALHAQAVLERIRRELVSVADAEARLLGPLAAHLGQAFGAAAWTIEMFSEEVLRGQFEFVVSALLRKSDELLRGIAGVGHWQVVSRGQGKARGVVETRASLAEVQGERFERDTILVVERLSGEEEIPGGIAAVLTASGVDLMSHVAVRARNAGIVLASGWDADRLADLRQRRGQPVQVNVTAEDEIAVGPADEVPAQAAPAPVRIAPSVTRVAPAHEYVTGEAAFDATRVGAKSRNLKALRGRLPDWIGVPQGVALPYGVCERVLGEADNQVLAKRHRELLGQLTETMDGEVSPVLAGLRQVTLELQAPPGLEAELRSLMSAAGIPLPGGFAEAWTCIKRVWASKWNERAHWSRRSMNLPEDGLRMAVLIQEVVPADYAFVIHTANPITGDRDDLVGELVLGLGETLVGNHPGRAFGFRRQRRQGSTRITSFPSKSVGLFGQGLMFRSDSSGEDLMGFAGAGLYDTVMLPEARATPLDYEKEELLWNGELRNRVVDGLAELGAAVEGVFGAPQDIEGVYAKGRFFVVQARPQVGLDHG